MSRNVWCFLLLLVLLLVRGLVCSEAKDKEGDDILKDALDENEDPLPGIDLASLDGNEDEGQEEGMSIEAILEEEHSFFQEKDKDDDGKLNKEEFISHYLETEGAGGADGAVDPASREDAAFAFREFDKDSDGEVSWEEWSVMMFHEAPQEPEFRDGEDADEDEKHLINFFRDADIDGNNQLSRHEVAVLLKSHGLDSQKTQEGENPKVFTKDEIEMITWQLLDDKDVDRDGNITLSEWIEGGGY